MFSRDAFSSVKRAVVLFGARVGGSLLTLTYTVLLTQVCSASDFGLAMTGLSVALLLSIPMSLNIESGSIRFLVEYQRRNDLAKLSGFVKSNRRIIVLFSSVLAVGASAVQMAGVFDFLSQEGLVVASAGATAPVLALTRSYGRHATAFDSVLKGSLPRMFVRPSLFCVVIFAVWLHGAEIAAYTVMLLFLVATLLTACLQTWLLRDDFSRFKSATPNYDDLPTWIRSGVLLSPLLVMRENLNNLAIVSSAFFLSKQEVGTFSLALSLISVMMFAVKSVDITISPKLSRLILGNCVDKALALLAASALGKLLATCCGAVAVALIGDVVFHLFGPDFSSIAGLVPILFVLPAASALLGQTELILHVTGNNIAIFIVSLIALAVTSLSVAFASAVAGLVGAAVGLVSVYLSQQFVLWYQCQRITGLDASAWVIISVLRKYRQTTFHISPWKKSSSILHKYPDA